MVTARGHPECLESPGPQHFRQTRKCWREEDQGHQECFRVRSWYFRHTGECRRKIIGRHLEHIRVNSLRINSGLIQCGEYSNQVLPNGKCRIVATLPQLDEQRCPDMFRCTDEVSYWLHENEERKQQILDLKETISELQEELRNHRHRIKVLELQIEEKNGQNSSLEHRFHELEQRYNEANTLLHIHGSLIYDVQAQMHNLSVLVEKVRRNPGCMINIVRSARLNIQEALHPGGGWTVIQRRQDGSVNFNRSWKEYKEGFGDLNTEFWMGNEHIHDISTQGDYTLRIDLEDWSSKHKHASYETFSIEDEANQYRLHVTGFRGTVEDSFSWYHNKHSFSTPDTGNICAEISHGGWWFHQCFFTNLNGVYYKILIPFLNYKLKYQELTSRETRLCAMRFNHAPGQK
ncbi:ANGL7 protein, partial [Polypterus senegalus]